MRETADAAGEGGPEGVFVAGKGGGVEKGGAGEVGEVGCACEGGGEVEGGWWWVHDVVVM